MIRVTPAALTQCQKILQRTGLHRFEFGLKRGGCAGFQYHFQPVASDTPVEDNDEILTIDKIQFQVCGRSQLYLFGTRIDWQADYMGQQFIFDNPLAKSQCGCGTSFQPSTLN